LVAIHEGVRALRSGEADVVLAGGVNALVTPLVTIGFDEVGGVPAPERPGSRAAGRPGSGWPTGCAAGGSARCTGTSPRRS
ncbi:hypothetical protein H7H37_11170, partial [Mycolicibacterium insubricum]|nr:hypothetical protein [Mycolicibacterium insubricum]